MIFDDHDVTDDWYLNQLWRDRVLTNSLGVTTIRNALLSYALFQAWGNDPAKFEKSEPHHAVLTEAEKIFLDGAPGPAVASAAKLDKLFGFDLRGTPQIDGSVAATKPPVTWHFSVDGPKHRVIAIDNRTRRSYATVNGPPGNVGGDAQVEQNPGSALAAGHGGPARRRAAAGLRATAPRRSRGAAHLPRLRRDRGDPERFTGRAHGKPARSSRYGRHQSRRDRGVGLRCGDVRSLPEAP